MTRLDTTNSSVCWHSCVLAMLIATTACAELTPPQPEPDIEGYEEALTASQKRPITDIIKARAFARGITNPLLVAGVPNHETGLVQCWKDATYHCQGPRSNYCGGPVLAGSGDGPCGNLQGGLGMYQFDAGTHAQTIAAYGAGILDPAGNIDQGINTIINKLKVCPNLGGVDTDGQAIAFLNAAVPGSRQFEDFLTSMAWCYNGCKPSTCSLHASRREAYRRGAQQLLDSFGRDYWFGGGGGGQTVIVSRPGDYDGDGKDDIITFGRGDSGDVYVARSTGTGFQGGVKWHDFFSIFNEIPSVGDFNGDGKSDLVTFTRGEAGDVIVSLSNGAGFLGGAKWHDFFAIRDEVPGVGDFNGDGKDDIITFGRGDSGDVYVGLSTGGAFLGGAKWSDYFCIFGEIPAVGDFNGDGKDDIVTFTRGDSADVIVSLSNGNGFDGASRWNDFFALGGELPVVADFNGDGKDDIATFTRGDLGDVYVALSNGTSFLPSTKWSDWMTPAQEIPGAGDFNGDGKADAITFVRGDRGDVYVAPSLGDRFAASTLWNDFFAIFAETPQPGANVY